MCWVTEGLGKMQIFFLVKIIWGSRAKREQHKRQQWFGCLRGYVSALCSNSVSWVVLTVTHKKTCECCVCKSLRPVFWAQKIIETKHYQKILSHWFQLDPFRHMDSLGTQHVYVFDTNPVCATTTASFTQKVLSLLLCSRMYFSKQISQSPFTWFGSHCGPVLMCTNSISLRCN